MVLLHVYKPSVLLSGLSTWQTENGSFPLCVKMAASRRRIEEKNVAVYSARGRGSESVCDPVWRRSDVRVTGLSETRDVQQVHCSDGGSVVPNAPR